MIVLGFTVQRGSVDAAGKWPCWNLLDATGKIVGQTTHPAYIADLIAAKQLAALLVANCAKVGQCVAEHARYQIAEDCFNDPAGIIEE